MTWTSPAPDEPAAYDEHRVHLTDAAHAVADRRGLTAAGAVAVALVVGVIGAAIDAETGHGLRTVFAVCFIGGSALAAVLVHREDLMAAVVIPPFTYCVLAVIGGVLGSTTVTGSFVTKEGVALVDALILRAPVLFIATVAAAAIALVRRSRQPSGRA